MKSNIFWKGIDVSDNQGTIDWLKVASAGVQFAILRTVRHSGKVDHQFMNNVLGCRENNIPFSGYKYTYAQTEADSRHEMSECIDVYREMDIPQGEFLWLDVEDRDALSNLGAVKLTNNILAAKEEIESAGYRFGLYTGLYVYNEKWFDFSQFSADSLWIARYPSRAPKAFSAAPDAKYKPNVGQDIWGWQWSSNGQLDGVNTAVDLDICYRDPVQGVQQSTEDSGSIYTVSVADVWTRSEAETIQKNLAAVGIAGVVHKVKVLE